MLSAADVDVRVAQLAVAAVPPVAHEVKRLAALRNAAAERDPAGNVAVAAQTARHRQVSRLPRFHERTAGLVVLDGLSRGFGAESAVRAVVPEIRGDARLDDGVTLFLPGTFHVSKEGNQLSLAGILQVVRMHLVKCVPHRIRAAPRGIRERFGHREQRRRQRRLRFYDETPFE